MPTPERRLAVIVLAAGEGKRMRSELPKPLHPVAGVPMLRHVLTAGAAANPVQTVLVVGPTTPDLAARLNLGPTITTVRQDSPRGTGDAVRQALPAVPDATHLLILFADNPLLSGAAVGELVDQAVATGARVTLTTARIPGGRAYGRIERDAAGQIIEIIEATSDPHPRGDQPIEVNSGAMVLDAAWARTALPRLTPDATTGEYYLTALPALAVADNDGQGGPAVVSAIIASPEAAFGVNNRAELAQVDALMRDSIRVSHQATGVTMIGAETIFIDAGVEIGPDTTILPGCYLQAGTRIGAGCTIGPAAVIANSTLGNRVVVRSSTITDSTINDDSDVGPYSHLRPGNVIGRGVHIGNFAELKNARLADGVKVGHVGYLGDAVIGAEANIGAGTITANFDGVRKNRTDIGANAFIGCDTILRAPVTIGDGATVGAGSVVTKDVPAGALAVGLPARIVRHAVPPPDQPAAVPPVMEED